MSNVNKTSYDLYRNRADGRFWAVLRVSPTRYIHTRWSYVSPATALRKLVYSQNTNSTANANRSEINHWVATAGVNRVSVATVRNIIKSNSNLMHHLVASGIIAFGIPNNARHRR
jgi:hypothetical protein